jgi:hypothetical protein
MCEVVRSKEKREREMGGWRRGRVGGGECELSLSPSSYVDHSFVQCERNAYGNSQHTKGFEAFVCMLFRVVGFIVEFGALGEISVALA